MACLYKMKNSDWSKHLQPQVYTAFIIKKNIFSFESDSTKLLATNCLHQVLLSLKKLKLLKLTLARLKGTVYIISSDPANKKRVVCSIYNATPKAFVWSRIFIFFTWKLIFLKCVFLWRTLMEIVRIYIILIVTAYSYKVLNGTVLNRTCHSCKIKFEITHAAAHWTRTFILERVC